MTRSTLGKDVALTHDLGLSWADGDRVVDDPPLRRLDVGVLVRDVADRRWMDRISGRRHAHPGGYAMAEIDTTSEDPRTSAIRIQLKAFELVRVIRQTFIAQDVYLDGRDFIDCRFIGCQPMSATGYFDLSGGQFMEGGTRVTLEGPAAIAHVTILSCKGQVYRATAGSQPLVTACPVVGWLGRAEE